MPARSSTCRPPARTRIPPSPRRAISTRPIWSCWSATRPSTLTLKTSPSDPGTNITATYYPTNSNPTNYVQITNNFPFLNITNFFGTNGASTNYFTDQRESDKVKVTDIDMGILKSWLVTNAIAKAKFPNTAGVYDLSKVPNILYAADNRTYSSGQLTAVRLKNGQIIPTNMVNIAGNNQPSGFTVATPNPALRVGQLQLPGQRHTWTIPTPPAHHALPGLAGVRRPDHPLGELAGHGQRSAL